MGGTILNVITVALGSTIGLLVGNRLSARIQESVIIGLGLVTLYVGMDNAAKTGNIIIPLLSIVFGVIIGELLGLDKLLQDFAAWLQVRFAGTIAVDENAPEADLDEMSDRERFVTGFVTATLVFCIGPLTFVGAIQDGMGLPIGFEQLAIKSTLDFFSAMAFASIFGVGVSFTVLSVFFIQGGLALLGSLAGEFMTAPMIAEMTAAGGIILLGLGLTLLDVKKPRIANFLPALVIAPLMVAIADIIGINIYPL